MNAVQVLAALLAAATAEMAVLWVVTGMHPRDYVRHALLTLGGADTGAAPNPRRPPRDLVDGALLVMDWAAALAVAVGAGVAA
jgi:hypothetical protein